MHIAIVCVPYQADIARWGGAQGPRALLEAGLLNRLTARGHTYSEPAWIELPRAERTRDTITNLGKIASRTSAAIAQALKQPDTFVLALTGDCNHSVGAIGGLAQGVGATPGVLWFDAHGDMHTFATSETGFIGGMPYAVALGWDLDDWRLAAGLETPVRPEAAALFGASDLDPAEEAALQSHPFARLDAADFDAATAQKVQALLAPRAANASAWYLHMDIDVAGTLEVPGCTTPTLHPPARDHILNAVQAATQTTPVRVCALSTYNPAGDPERRGARFSLDVLDAVLKAF